jgi:acetyl-CoA acetyltransferase
MQWMLPFGAFSGPTWMGMWATRHMHEFGTTREQIAAIALNARRNAQRNPKAVLQGDLTMDDYLSSKMISDPLCLFDCDIAVDGVTALIVSTADHAPDVPTTPVHFEAVGSALHGRASWDQWEDMTQTAAAGAGEHLWSRTALKPADVDVANLYDGFSVLTLFWLEGLGFCGKGESGPFVEGGTRIALDGELPLATSGGQLSAGRLHGFGHLYEACLQLRGQAEGRQVKNAKVAVTSAGAGPLASCLLLRTA